MFAILFVAACDENPVVDEPDNLDTKDKAEYNLTVAGKDLIGDGVDSNWDSYEGIV